jgi:hypothetical protein
MCKVADEYAIYKDGNQVTYIQDTSTGTIAGDLYIAARGSGANYFDGYLDEIRIDHSNIFGASPNTGKTDTITIPTAEYPYYNDMTLISDPFTAEAQPDDARIVLFEEDIDSATINTDLKAYVSRDGGTTYSQVTLTDEGDYETSKRILSGTVDISGQPSGTSMKYKITTHNNKGLKLHGTGLLWD